MAEVDCLCMCVREWKHSGSTVGRTEQDLELGTKTSSPILPGDVTNSRGSSPSSWKHVFRDLLPILIVMFLFVTVGNSDPTRIFVAVSQNVLL